MRDDVQLHALAVVVGSGNAEVNIDHVELKIYPSSHLPEISGYYIILL